MILHVYDAAKKSNSGEVYVATPDQKIIDKVKSYGGNAILTEQNHQTGTDRVYEVFKKILNEIPKIIVNLQGDMPNIDPKSIKQLIDYMLLGKCDIATLSSTLQANEADDILFISDSSLAMHRMYSIRLTFDPDNVRTSHIGEPAIVDGRMS